MLLIADVELTSMGALLTQNPIDLGPLTAPITLFASVGVINAINMSDRIDGLSGVCVSISRLYSPSILLHWIVCDWELLPSNYLLYGCFSLTKFQKALA